jgi:hypothetical protein
MEEKSLATEILSELKEQNKRLFRTLVISIVSFLSIICVVIGCFIWYLSLPVDDVSMEAKGGNANYNYVGEDMKGDINNGEGNSTETGTQE